MNIKDAKTLINLARLAISNHFVNKKTKLPNKFNEKKGVFVTLNSWPAKRLRGCIGYPQPVLPLNQAIVESAKSAAFSDPRFPQLIKSELNNIIIEISILTKPELTKTEKIKIGKDGLICQLGYNSGLLLPQVAIEYKMSKEEFLEAVCQKAGLPSNVWMNKRTKLYKFQAQIFKEEKPTGKVIEEKLS